MPFEAVLVRMAGMLCSGGRLLSGMLVRKRPY
jgi:hypothetical protein